MNNEIKEILAYFEEYIKITDMHDSEPMLNWKDLKIVLDYITKLQEDIRTGQEIIGELQEAKDSLQNDYQEAVDKITNLQQENERLKKALNCKEYFSSTMPEDTEFVILTKKNYDRQQKDIQFELIDYKSRCEKASEFINKFWKEKSYYESVENCLKFATMNEFEKEDLLNILQNGSDSQ